jgi:hypothetical protein
LAQAQERRGERKQALRERCQVLPVPVLTPKQLGLGFNKTCQRDLPSILTNPYI